MVDRGNDGPNSPRGQATSSQQRANVDDTLRPGAPQPRELALSAAWNGGLARELVTNSGERINVVFVGNWTHGYGPDFADAMIAFADGRLHTGAVEIHRRVDDWTHHGHHVNPTYNDVILHVVTQPPVTPVRREDGRLVPTVLMPLPIEQLQAIDAGAPDVWATLGGEVCAEHIALQAPRRIVSLVHALGDRRLDLRVQEIIGELDLRRASQVLLIRLMDAFGYRRNREPMRAIAEILIADDVLMRMGQQHGPPLAFTDTLAVLLGVGGMLPLAPRDAHAGRIPVGIAQGMEAFWHELAAEYGMSSIRRDLWHLGQSRPANHPVARTMALAALLTWLGDDPVGKTLAMLSPANTAVQQLQTACDASLYVADAPRLGKGRAVAMLASVIVPFAHALATQMDNENLQDAAAKVWATLPVAEWTRPGKRGRAQVAGDVRLHGLGERGHQGLLHLDRHLCTPRRCYECPIAHEVVQTAMSTNS